MATAVTADTYLQQIHTAKTQLQAYFMRAHELLAAREELLLRQLEDIQNNYEMEVISQQEELLDLEKSKQHLKSLLHDNDTLKKSLAPLDDKIAKILKIPLTNRTIKFQWNTNFERYLEHAGEIITSTNIPQTVISQSNVTVVIPDYKTKLLPVISCCKQGRYPGELTYPGGLVIEPQSGRLYIADTNNRVQVYTANGEYCYMFNSNMNSPWGICINNDIVYVSQYYGHCVNLYKLDGTYLSTVGTMGAKNGQFTNPVGIAVSPISGHLYVCDWSNNRVQIFDKSLKFVSTFGKNTSLHPKDVNLINDFIFVLVHADLCILIFNITDRTLLKSVISRSVDRQISHPLFFTVDAALNIVITDNETHCVKVFNSAGVFITQFGKEGHAAGEFINPTGIVIDSQNRIVVVSENKNSTLQLF